ncbi:carbon-nitrogen hydrolase family protein [Thioclava nitratireducens]|uniref:carbon-nitrogen hydrolase family protein n=1 Tax=Thioclava nitratireducens TaxID=1915078 RepID=UPI0024809682|nr:carbon-nitrogen hydrolase family protein [Thioclava nitratireducens]WGT52322.1 carbon-nitrogen hydrolase family protein [Thioclava nitratireducens]
MTIAAAAYPLDWFDDWSGYAAKVTTWVTEAAGQGALLLVFPEYGAMELASLGGAEVAADLEAALAHVAGLRADMETLFANLAAKHGVHILAPSGPVIEGPKRVNRASLFGPGGLIGHQDKAIMTRFEREIWHVDAGEGLALFDTALGKIGVTICYDSEFPLLARALAEAGAEIILVPSCTDTLAGYNRVRIGAMARALENQCVTVQAPTVGDALWCPAVDENRGTAAIFAPPDGLWPESGVVAEGAPDSPGWTFATVDLDRVAQSRTAGAVLPYKHWSEQSDAAQIIRIASENPAQP